MSRKRKKSPRVTVDVTLSDLWDIVTCLDKCYAKGLGYGHGGDDNPLVPLNRKRLTERLYAMAQAAAAEVKNKEENG